MAKERLLRTDVATDFIFPVEVIVKTRLIKYLNDSITEIDNTSNDLYDHEGIAYRAGQKAALEKIKKELEGR